ncbi:DUF6364 family protein [Halpernia frigidisoli]|nr:DUF6364 family protein [Halpernia frigidisoli]
MTTKLTLTIEKDIIEKAKIYAKGTQRSLSEMVQKYLENLGKVEDKEELSPQMKNLLDKIPKKSLVNELAGSLKMPKNFTDEELDNFRRDYLENKYK